MNRSLKRRFTRNPGQQGVELENHFILRLPQPQAETLRELLRSNQSTNIKDRLGIQLDFTQDKDDMRNGIITIDTIMHKARLMDFPSILESWKTIDGKNFYKTADICQMLKVKEGEDPAEDEDNKKKRRDHPNRVDKKYLWPHGYTPPLKNVRKRRFRKMLRKKILELPEIEKEVKRLLRADEDALNVKWEVVMDDDEKGGVSGITNDQHDSLDDTAMQHPTNLDEQLFGEMVSSSDDEVGPINILDEDDDSRLSVEDTRFSESYMQDGAVNSPHLGSKMSSSSMMHQQHHQQLTQLRPMGDYDHYNQDLAPHHQQFTTLQPAGPHDDQPSTSSSSAVRAQQSYFTEFNPSMFRNMASDSYQDQDSMGASSSHLGGAGTGSATFGGHHHSSSMVGGDDSYDDYDANDDMASSNAHDLTSVDPTPSSSINRDNIKWQLAELSTQLSELSSERASHQNQLDSLDNAALKSRFLSKLQDIDAAIDDKQEQMRQLKASLQ